DGALESVDALVDVPRVPAQPSVGAAPEVVLVQPSAEVEIIRGRLSRHVEGELTGDLVAPRGEKRPSRLGHLLHGHSDGAAELGPAAKPSRGIEPDRHV